MMLTRISSLFGQHIFKRKSKAVLAAQTVPYSTVDNEEIRKFTNQADQWWSSNRILISLNEIRVPLVRDGLTALSQKTVKGPHPLKEYKIMDVGCGGGIFSEALARLGANVTGLDPGLEMVELATEHASKDDEIKDRLTYICDSVENIAGGSRETYDAVVCSEVIEHVADVPTFVKHCVEIVKENGSIFFTTLNRTFMSHLIAIVLAEYVIRAVPRGTHEWSKFVTPKELIDILQPLNCRIVSKEGYMINPITKKFTWCGKNDTFYGLHAQKLPAFQK